MVRKRLLLAFTAAVLAFSPVMATSPRPALGIGSSDTIGPVLWSFTPSPAVVDVGSGDAVVTYRIELTDDASGIDAAASTVELRSPGGVLAQTVQPLTPVPGSGSEYTYTLRIAEGSESGVWIPRGVFFDRAGNQHTVSTSDLLGYGRTKTVVVTKLSADADAVDARVVSASPLSSIAGSPVTLAAGAVDSNGHAITAYEWFSSVDGLIGTTSDPTLATSALSVGSHLISVRARCEAGLWSSTTSFGEPLVVRAALADAVAPMTTSDAVANYTGSATVRLSALDLFGTGVAHTYLALDGGLPVEGASVTVNAPGRHTLTFWSVDAAGNVEAPTTASFAIQAVKTRAALSKPAAPLSVRRRAGFTVSGAVSPAHAVGTSLVTLRFYRYESGHYVLRKTVAAKAASSAAGRSTYAVRTSLSSRGKWRVRAVHADASHLTSYSSYRYIIVK